MVDGGNDYLAQAATAILYAVFKARELDSSANNNLQPGNFRALLAEARRLLALADPKEDPHRFAAAKEALELLEADERGEVPPGTLEIFHAHVEAVHGGPRNIDFGGIHVPNKPTAKESFLRAAAVALWDEYPGRRESLSKEAKQILGMKDKKTLGRLVDNFHQRHDQEPHKSKSPLSIHMRRVRELIKINGYQSLRDFT
jgi:hypothetical protein